MVNNYEYDNIMALAKKAGYKKIMVIHNSWGQGSWAIVNSVTLKSDGRYGFASGHIHYSNGNTSNGNIQCAGNYSWRTIKVLEEDMVVKQL